VVLTGKVPGTAKRFQVEGMGCKSQSTGERIQETGKEKRLIHGVERIRVASSGILEAIFRNQGLSYSQKPIWLAMIGEVETDVAGDGGGSTRRRRKREQHVDQAQAALRA
jgi:hypothetical protein